MELIKITEQNGKQVISARDLHSFLESKKQFGNWIKHRITKYGLIEGQDYVTFNQMVNRSKTTEYALTLDAAKELSMVEGNAKGKQARQYFIECERKAQQPVRQLSPMEMLELQFSLVKEQGNRINYIEEKVLQIEAKAKTQPDDYYTIAGYASLLKKPVDIVAASAIGRKSTTLCNQLGFMMGVVPDPRFGRVKTYPQQVLSETFKEYFK
jgi:anti-repressor protein